MKVGIKYHIQFTVKNKSSLVQNLRLKKPSLIKIHFWLYWVLELLFGSIVVKVLGVSLMVLQVSVLICF